MSKVETMQGKFEGNKFYFPVRVYYEDTDAGGIVYYANYLKFAERARTEYVRAIGLRQQDALEQEEKAAFVVRHCDIDYKSPAVLDDLLTVVCEVTEFGGASVVMHQDIMRGDEILVSIDIKVVYVLLKNKRPSRLPAELVKSFKGE